MALFSQTVPIQRQVMNPQQLSGSSTTSPDSAPAQRFFVLSPVFPAVFVFVDVVVVVVVVGAAVVVVVVFVP